jgi:hypothetical protein
LLKILVVVMVALLLASRFVVPVVTSRGAFRAVPKSQIAATPLTARCPDMRRPDGLHAPIGKKDAATAEAALT